MAIAWDVIAAIACWLGLRINRPDDRTAWVLLASGVSLLGPGDLVCDVSVYCFGHTRDPVPLSDALPARAGAAPAPRPPRAGQGTRRWG
jgi:hypothetical protein